MSESPTTPRTVSADPREPHRFVGSVHAWDDYCVRCGLHDQRHPEPPAPKPATATATVTLFKPSGKYYTEERWEVPDGAVGPWDMEKSTNFRRIDGGPVLVDTQEPWGFPHLL